MTGDKRYELSNHLGNVLVVINDKKIPEFEKPDMPETGLVAFNADVLSYSDYYPFGMLQDARHGSKANYRYGFQGQEMDNEIKGEGNSLNYTFRMHDPRVGRFFAVDPLEKKYPWYTPYSFSGNKVIAFKELEGEEERWAIKDHSVIYDPGPKLGGYDSEMAAYKALYEIKQKNKNANPTVIIQDNRTNEERKKNQIRWANYYADLEATKEAMANHDNLGSRYTAKFVMEGVANGAVELTLDMATEGAYTWLRTTRMFTALSKSRIVQKTAGAFDGLISAGYKTEFAQQLRSIINPNGAKTNCVACSIEFQKSTMSMLYGNAGSAPAYGLTQTQVVEKLFANFSDVKTFTSGLPDVSSLSSKLDGSLLNNSNSAIIVGTLKDQSKFQAHAFNAVKGSDGKWQYMDLQNGVMYNEKAMEKTFSSYRIYDVK